MTQQDLMAMSQAELDEFRRLNEQLAQLQKRIEEMRPRVQTRARLVAMQLMAQHGLSVDQVVTPPARAAMKAGTPRYRDPATGKTWSGLGTIPAWIKDKDRSQFLIGDAA